MSCSCSTDRLVFAVPDAYRDVLPENPVTVAVCPTCLTIDSADRHTEEATATPTDLADVSPAFPPTEDAAVPMVLAIGLLRSMALHREAIDELLTAVETAGVDPMLVLDRLQTDPHLDPAIDVSRRRRQLEQLRE